MSTKKPASPFIRLSEAGKPVTPRTKNHAMVKDTTTGLIWAAAPIEVKTWAEAEAACKALRLGGHKDWRMPTIKELISIVDYGKREPAIDTKAFRMKAGETWHRFWSSSPVVGWPEGAWGVLFRNGVVSLGHRRGSGFVRPVRVARGEQP